MTDISVPRASGPVILTTDEAIALAREVFAPFLRPSFPWFVVPSLDDFLGYALWNETAWPFKRDRETLKAQLEVYARTGVQHEDRPR